MKKILAILLTVAMLLSLLTVYPLTAFAADTIYSGTCGATSINYPNVDIRDMGEYGQDNTYLGDTPIATAPTIDGIVNANEYQQVFTILKDGDEKWEYVDNMLATDINEYYAYDEDNFYVAIQIPQEKGAWMYFTVHAWDSPDGNLYRARKNFCFYDAAYPITWGTVWEGNEMANGTFGVQRNTNIDLASGGWYEGEFLPAGTRILNYTMSYDDGDFDVEITTDTATNITTYEFKFSKVGLAKSFRSAGADAADDINYIGIRYQWCQENNADTYGNASADPSGTIRSWYPQTDENGNNASYVLDEAGLAAGDCTPHFVFAEANTCVKHTWGTKNSAAAFQPTLVLPANCAEVTYEIWKCMTPNCGSTQEVVIKSAKGHTYYYDCAEVGCPGNDGDNTTSCPTCLHTRTKKCADCSVVNDVIPAATNNPHADENMRKESVPASCQVLAHDKLVCVNADCSFEKILVDTFIPGFDPNNHAGKYFVSAVVPTCYAEGVETWKCDCGVKTWTTSIDKIPCTNELVKIPAIAATCNTVGWTEGLYCPDPTHGKTIKIDVLNNGTVDESWPYIDETADDFTYTGVVVEPKILAYNKANHNYAGLTPIETVVGTCTIAGYRVYECANVACKAETGIAPKFTITDGKNPTNHIDRNGIPTIMTGKTFTAATHAKSGYHAYNICAYCTVNVETASEKAINDAGCAVCALALANQLPSPHRTYAEGEAYDKGTLSVVEIPAIGHSFDPWKIFEGTIYVTECSCGEKKYHDHANENHLWDDGVVSGNEKIYTCTICNATKSEEIETPPVINPEAFTLVVENKTMKLGDSVEVNLVLENNPGIAGIVITLNYDTEALGTPTITNGEILSTMQGAVNIVFYNDTDSTADGTLATLTFTPTKAGEYEIGVTVRECTNIALDDVEVMVVNGTLTVLDFVYGDADGNNKVNLKDAVLLATYLANYDYDTGTSSVELQLGADANGDGKINLKDAVLVATYIANYDYDTGSSTVVLGPVTTTVPDGWTPWH